jgi:hypothetical protein
MIGLSRKNYGALLFLVNRDTPSMKKRRNQAAIRKRQHLRKI